MAIDPLYVLHPNVVCYDSWVRFVLDPESSPAYLQHNICDVQAGGWLSNCWHGIQNVQYQHLLFRNPHHALAAGKPVGQTSAVSQHSDTTAAPRQAIRLVALPAVYVWSTSWGRKSNDIKISTILDNSIIPMVTVHTRYTSEQHDRRPQLMSY